MNFSNTKVAADISEAASLDSNNINNHHKSGSVVVVEEHSSNDDGKQNASMSSKKDRVNQPPSSLISSPGNTTTNKKKNMNDTSNSREGRKPDPVQHMSSWCSHSSNIFPPAEQESNHEVSSTSPALPPQSSAVTSNHTESRLQKMLTRSFYGILMMVCFAQLLYMGHMYACAFVAVIETLLFRELVQVRYNTHFHIVHDTIPLFRTTQWLWFAVAIFYTYLDFVAEVVKSNPDLHYLLGGNLEWAVPSGAFTLYTGTFVITICTLQTGYIKFQVNQLCWTIVVLCLTVGQLKYIMHNIYNGLFWFLFPISLVVTNDINAYIAGLTCGRKFIRRPFLALSPNKTWEGFIGGGFATLIFGWYFSKFLSQFTWMTCPTNVFSFFPDKLECTLDPIFLEANSIFPPQMFDILPTALVKIIPGVVDVCSVEDLTISEDLTTSTCHKHFELIIEGVLPIQIHALFLALFASLVAPFGGFLASAIKRAYGIKDFDSIIPGHGGLMDRFDCQFLMALCTWVHYNTFVKMTTVSVPKLVYMYKLLKENEKEEFRMAIADM